MLISQAVLRARNSFGKNHQKYADALLDYGFFLLNVDTIARSVDVYMVSSVFVDYYYNFWCIYFIIIIIL